MGRLISVRNTGNFQKTDRFLSGLIGVHYMRKLKKYGAKGVAALREATPKDSGKTAEALTNLELPAGVDIEINMM